jgi:hypothetical protein
MLLHHMHADFNADLKSADFGCIPTHEHNFLWKTTKPRRTKPESTLPQTSDQRCGASWRLACALQCYKPRKTALRTLGIGILQGPARMLGTSVPEHQVGLVGTTPQSGLRRGLQQWQAFSVAIEDRGCGGGRMHG